MCTYEGLIELVQHRLYIVLNITNMLNAYT